MKNLALLIATVTSLLLPVASFRVARLADGDVFDNIEGSEMSCTASGAQCSDITSVLLYYEDCYEYNLFNASCSACKCTNGGRLNLLRFQCESRIDFIDSSASGLEECPTTVGFYPFESLEPFPGSPALLPRQILFLNKTFSCFGKVTKWKIRQFNARLFAYLFAIQVWRQVGDWFFLVNSTFFDVPESQGVGYTDVEYELDGNEIYFQPGDFLGAFSSKGLDGFPFAVRPVIPASPPDSSVTYVFNVLDTPPERLRVTDVRRIFDGVIAHMAAVVDPGFEEETLECFDMEPPSPTDPQPQTSPTTVVSQGPTEATVSEPLIPVLGIVAIASGTMLLVIIAVGCVVVIGLVVYCNNRRRKKDGLNRVPQDVGYTYMSPYTYITTFVSSTPTTPYANSRAATFDHIYETLPDSLEHDYAVLERPTPDTPECPSLDPSEYSVLERPTPDTPECPSLDPSEYAVLEGPTPDTPECPSLDPSEYAVLEGPTPDTPECPSLDPSEYSVLEGPTPDTPECPSLDPSEYSALEGPTSDTPECPSLDPSEYAVLEGPIPDTPECPSLHSCTVLESPTSGTAALCYDSEGVSSRPVSTADANRGNDHIGEEPCGSANTEDKEDVNAKEPPKIPTSLKEEDSFSECTKVKDGHSDTKENTVILFEQN